MLEKVISIDNVGVIKNGVLRPITLEKVTLIYADNARGKSTLAALLNACASANVPELTKRKTIGTQNDQKVLLRFKAPAGDFNAQFNGNVWAGQKPNLHVFNQEFVERNVYASSGVTPDQRASLLELALGDAAVTAQAEFYKQSELQRTKAGEVREAEGALTGYRSDLTVDRFIALQEAPNADAEIQALDKQIADAQDIAVTLAKPDFKKLNAPTFDLAQFKSIVGSEFEQVQDGAEELVKKHLDTHLGAATEHWVATGLHHKPEPDCPFCGQKTEGLALIQAYKTYFNQAYKDYLASIESLHGLVTQGISAAFLSSWAGIQAFNEGAASSWNGVIEFTLPTIDIAAAENIIQEAQKSLVRIAEHKKAFPLEAIKSSHVAEIEANLISIITMVTTFNAEIDAINEKISAHKKTLVTADLQTLTAKRMTLKLQKVRHDPEVKALVDAVTSARNEYKNAEKAKNDAKTNLDNLMANLLTTFQTAINYWLGLFGAPFNIEKLTTSYAGGDPRGHYVINVRGAKVNIGPGAAGELSFHAALSEGDKRTLAFAFFLARLFADPNRAHASVVLDDVFTSLDHHRRHNTANAVVKMVEECAQVIVLGHDAHFLRELRKRVRRMNVGETLELCLHRDADNCSLLTNFELDEFCASDYYKNYVLTEKFLAGEVPQEKLLDVAKALRPLVEGHMHKSFPKRFKDGQTVGQMLDIVKNATSPNPLVALQPLHRALCDFNEFAASFHHDTSGGHPRTDINDAELRQYALAALNFIQSRKLW
ncbi:AAA family ATPase [Chromobacterium haemolyticum]|uniref:AAA family ATPase n=1 Tax=Chromobacterium TaxID=535 RepID=UPI00405733BB